MTKTPPLIDLINLNMEHAKSLGIGQLYTEDQSLKHGLITTNGQEAVHFGSCSYLNLELDPRLKESAIDAINRYGVQFSASRAYISIDLYEELESLLSKLFGRPTLVSPSSTLGHMSNIPFLVTRNDAIILDHQVHNSVQNAVQIAKANGAHVEMIRHNNLDFLEARIKKLSTDYQKIWYMADGVYSMYGDVTPIKELHQLMDKYEQLHLYVDDAHGMSWAGKNGAGYILNKVDHHPRMVLVTSFAKGFGSGGGATIFYDEKMRTNIKNCGSTHIFSGPLQPPVLGAAIASAKIHLTDEITLLQQKLDQNLAYFIRTAHDLDLPLVDSSKTPIKYIGIGNNDIAFKLCQELLKRGYYTCIAGYPSVPYNNSGIRITINQQHSWEQIFGLLSTLSVLMDEMLGKTNASSAAILGAFKHSGNKLTVRE